MTKLFIALLAAHVSLTSLSLAATQLDLEQEVKLHEKSGICYTRDNFKNYWPNTDNLDGEPLKFALQTFVSSITEDPNSQGNVIFIDLKIENFNKSKWIKEAGFTLHNADDNTLQWKIQNGSSMPAPMTSTGGARAVILDQEGQVLIIEDKNLPGRLMFPGGSNDKGELFETTTIRETREEVGLTVKPGACRLIAQLNRVKANRYGANDICLYYLVESFTGKVSIQPSEVSWAGWVKIDDIVDQNGFSIPGSRLLKASSVSLAILRHIKDGAEKPKMMPLPDLRQMGKPVDQQDPKDVMHLNLFPVHPKIFFVNS